MPVPQAKHSMLHGQIERTGLLWGAQQLHRLEFAQEPVRFPRIARAAGRHEIGPRVLQQKQVYHDQ